MHALVVHTRRISPGGPGLGQLPHGRDRTQELVHSHLCAHVQKPWPLLGVAYKARTHEVCHRERWAIFAGFPFGMQPTLVVHCTPSAVSLTSAIDIMFLHGAIVLLENRLG